ncbi:MAG: iron-containing alcohol dehydrogenase [Candidatus Humimicrobiaceae bacterium]
MANFDFENKVKLIFGTGRIKELSGLCKNTGTKPMLVSTHKLADKSGFGTILETVLKILKDSNIDPVIYDRAVLNPTTDSVDEAAKIARVNGVDFIIGLGGGSAVDTAKAIAVSAKSGRPIIDYLYGEGHEALEIKEALPIIAIDTTAGSGTATTMFFVVTNPKTNEKSGNGSPVTWAKYSIVDPALMLGIPKNVTAATGLDAFYHALEAYLANNSNPISDIFSIRSIELCQKYLPVAYDDGKNIEARENMALASVLAGYAINSASTVLLHAIGHSVSGFTNIAHGLALSALSEAWIEFTYPSSPKRVNEAMKIFNIDLNGLTLDEAAKKASKAMHDFKKRLGVDITLKVTGLKNSQLSDVADDTFTVMQGCVDRQPGKPITKNDVQQILQNAYRL